ncbi:MAG TPA: non-homologous end-joining DNA ligase, partial [Thermoanaerobaculia bacterium]|nr:non-homologous end-joining DNA ligase [Thermoanaerobaculia bacterium]
MTPRQLLKKVFPPMLATLADGPPKNDDDWHYELKYDGFRAVIAISAGKVSMLSRNELDLAPRFPRMYDALQKVKAKEVVVDGEVVVLDEKGAPRFQLLQQGSGKERLILFDILWLDGEDLRRRPYEERRKILQKTFARPPANIYVAESLEMSGEKALALAAKGGWEGIIAKRKGSIYETRRSKEWLKVKAIQQQEFVIVGWQPSTASDRDIGSLHLAVNEAGELRYAGKVGTGFSAKLRTWLRDELAKDVVAKPMIAGAPRVKTATWVKPRLVGQVSFTEWTTDHRLRHPSFLGLREDKRVEDVVHEKPVEVARASARAKGGLKPAPHSSREKGGLKPAPHSSR